MYRRCHFDSLPISLLFSFILTYFVAKYRYTNFNKISERFYQPFLNKSTMKICVVAQYYTRGLSRLKSTVGQSQTFQPFTVDT